MVRSFLFVPADSERKLAKGAESGADSRWVMKGFHSP